MDYRPLPDFHPHLKTFLYRGESGEMWIPGSPEAQALSEGLKDRPFPRHHIAVCKQESLTFIELPNLSSANGLHAPALESQGPCFGTAISHSDSSGWPSTVCSTDSWNYRGLRLNVDHNVGPEDIPIGEPSWADLHGVRDLERNSVPPSKTPPSPLSDWESCNASSPTLDIRPSLELCGLQRRTSQGSDREKSVRRKMKVYSPESLSDESLSSPSLECEYLFPGSIFEEELNTKEASPMDAVLPAGGIETKPPAEKQDTILPGHTLQDKSSSDAADTTDFSEGILAAETANQSSRNSEQERRRFSASELISRLQLSQRKSSFSLKLGKSLSARVTSKDKGAPRSLSPEGKQNARDQSSASSIDSAPHSPLGPGPLLPGDCTVHVHKGTSRHRKNSIEENAYTPAFPSYINRLSRFMPNSILYQEYSDVAINREIQRQQWADAINEEDEDGVAQPSCNISPTNSFRSQRSSRGSAFSLWQDIPDVRASGMLATFSNEERKLQEAKFELVTSEASYIRSLSIAVDHFMCSRELADCLGTQERQWLFSKLPNVKAVSERFLQDLEVRLEEDILRFDVCDIVLAHCPAFRRVYLPYVTNQAYQEQTYQRLLQENPRFPGILARLEEDQVCQRLPLTSFLILPFQRITRLKMLVENILKRTAPGSQDEDTATKAFNELKKLIKECNSSVQSMKRTEELIHLNKKIHFEGKIFPLISQSRWLVKHGELVEVDTQTISMSGSKFKLRPVYLHLFNDCLLLSRKKETGKFAVFVHAKIGELKVKDLNMKLHGISGFIFHLQLCEERRLKHQILLKANTESEKQRWIAAMFPSDPVMSKGQISENEDLAQVQCIKSYKAQEHDELTLEKADILQAKTRTSDGWIEGIRLSDGERGWFPRNYVEEITSRSARVRNLRENNRIKCATQKLEEEYL
ncbi:rho guanine nucleotide exchange factor 19-like [Acipenser ruthenus]|uniref:rho guanine nucleotide exchange factor 19-like n=1 Tax=Acipenser ruthenus TaxID=7906 RepID=UPI00145A8F5E|nr:rho guanine nucleotide exchange factor 19-like [Acipenser ruthenus]XP_058858378.1 rho guanine nucleotide exchange factor 19-like [Acipenser ruthenus]